MNQAQLARLKGAQQAGANKAKASPAPPRQYRPDLPEWLQEVILRCLEPEAAQRYPSAAHLAFDLADPDQVPITERGRRLRGPGVGAHFKRWIKAAGMHYQPSPLPARQIAEVPILMGGHPAQALPDYILQTPNIDMACVGEGAIAGGSDAPAAVRTTPPNRTRCRPLWPARH